MRVYRGVSVAIVTATDEPFAKLLFDLCDSLGPWSRYLYVLDIGLGEASCRELTRRRVELVQPPDGFFASANLSNNYFKAMYSRPSLPILFPTVDVIMWIDSDCWVQRRDAIASYLDSALAFPDAFTICPMLDAEYGCCIDDYRSYQERYREQYQALFGPEEADQLFCKAILSSGVFSARTTSAVWETWRATVRRTYESRAVADRFDLGHMAEQLALNLVLYRDRSYRIFPAEMNWHCHCSDVVRDRGYIRVRPSGRIPAIVHLSDLKSPSTAERYRRERIHYEHTRTIRALFQRAPRRISVSIQ